MSFTAWTSPAVAKLIKQFLETGNIVNKVVIMILYLGQLFAQEPDPSLIFPGISLFQLFPESVSVWSKTMASGIIRTWLLAGDDGLGGSIRRRRPNRHYPDMVAQELGVGYIQTSDFLETMA